MSNPMRFSLKHHGQLSCVEHCPEGEYVLHSDYARLKEEVEQYSEIVQTAHVDLFSQNARLKAEVERLRKAGDDMADFFVPDIDDLGHNYGFKKSVESVILNWNAAKEGKPSV